MAETDVPVYNEDQNNEGIKAYEKQTSYIDKILELTDDVRLDEEVAKITGEAHRDTEDPPPRFFTYNQKNPDISTYNQILPQLCSDETKVSLIGENAVEEDKQAHGDRDLQNCSQNEYDVKDLKDQWSISRVKKDRDNARTIKQGENTEDKLTKFTNDGEANEMTQDFHIKLGPQIENPLAQEFTLTNINELSTIDNSENQNSSRTTSSETGNGLSRAEKITDEDKEVKVDRRNQNSSRNEGEQIAERKEISDPKTIDIKLGAVDVGNEHVENQKNISKTKLLKSDDQTPIQTEHAQYSLSDYHSTRFKKIDNHINREKGSYDNAISLEFYDTTGDVTQGDVIDDVKKDHLQMHSHLLQSKFLWMIKDYGKFDMVHFDQPTGSSNEMDLIIDAVLAENRTSTKTSTKKCSNKKRNSKEHQSSSHPTPQTSFTSADRIPGVLTVPSPRNVNTVVVDVMKECTARSNPIITTSLNASRATSAVSTAHIHCESQPCSKSSFKSTGTERNNKEKGSKEILEKIKTKEVKKSIKTILGEHLMHQTYDIVYLRNTLPILADCIKVKIKNYYPARYRLICLLNAMEMKSQSARIVSKFCWDKEKDDYTECVFHYGDFVITCIVYAVYKE